MNTFPTEKLISSTQGIYDMIKKIIKNDHSRLSQVQASDTTCNFTNN